MVPLSAIAFVAVDWRRFGVRMNGAAFKRKVGEVVTQCWLVLQILLLAAFFYFELRWLGNIEVATLDDFWHLAVKES